MIFERCSMYAKFLAVSPNDNGDDGAPHSGTVGV